MKRHGGCRISGSESAGEIPLPPSFFYLFGEAGLGVRALFRDLRTLSVVLPGPMTLSGGEFGWGGTSVKRQHRCPKESSMRTEISCRT